jgi:hypothetical protein
MHHWLRCAFDVQTFWPDTRNVSPSRTARVLSAARSDPRRGAHHLLLEDHLLDQARAPPSVFARPGDADPPPVVQPPVPGEARVEGAIGVQRELVVRGGPLRAVRRQLAFEPGAELGPEHLVGRGECEVHRQGVW